MQNECQFLSQGFCREQVTRESSKGFMIMDIHKVQSLLFVFFLFARKKTVKDNKT